MNLVSVILSGGAGTRLWPVSRRSHPKPFMVLGGRTLLEQAIVRGQGCGAVETMIVANQDHLVLTQAVIAAMANRPRTRYLLEPKGRNTAPAVALAALAAAKAHGPDVVLLVLPADHLIADAQSFVADALRAVELARKGSLVVFGIQPSSPETGFGYIEVSKVDQEPQSVLRFVEKPNLAVAQEYLATGRFYWNSGMFCFTAGTILDAFRKHAPDVLDAAEESMATAEARADVLHFSPEAFCLQPDISLDYAVMERADNVAVIPAKFPWSDVGAWSAVADAHTADANGNTMACQEPIDWVAVDTTGTHVHVESHGKKRVVATIGVRDLVVVHTPDALLIANKRQAQDVKKVVNTLTQRHIDSPQHQSTLLPAEVIRPWGAYTTLREEPGYKVKRIVVRKGQSLSLQYHRRRAEHWVVVRGQGIVQIGDLEYPTSAGEYRYVPLGERHRLTNIGADDLILIEVQCGDYLGEDDIVRLADVYGRAGGDANAGEPRRK